MKEHSTQVRDGYTETKLVSKRHAQYIAPVVLAKDSNQIGMSDYIYITEKFVAVMARVLSSKRREYTLAISAMEKISAGKSIKMRIKSFDGLYLGHF